ncbi:hypothetical protein AX15_005832 [Amanita polypyramis BW_CC]|nr:hypothetical protein AX15_005832 [Amanita polypyramis BW_CC]
MVTIKPTLSELLAMTDESTMLCLTCSSSIPPSIIRRYKQGLSDGLDPPRNEDIFFTNCCKKPICPSCIAVNARLKQYDPCLHCLGGVSAIVSSNLGAPISSDQDIFVLADDDDDDDDDGDDDGECLRPGQELPSHEATTQMMEQIVKPRSPAEQSGHCTEQELRGDAPFKYYLTLKDTLQGIVLRYGASGYEICRLNKLPPSTLTTTPHLLHTRTYILLPPASKAGAL